MAFPRPRRYRPEDNANLGDFDCCADPANPKEYEQEINDWIRDLPPGTIAGEIANGNAEEIYVYEVGESGRKRIIAYGVLTTETWELEEGDAAGNPTQVSLIAMLGLHRDFHGRAVGGEGTERYSTLIFQDILARAAKRCGPERVIGLYVHPDNGRATGLYERFGFDRSTRITWESPVSYKTYHGMVLYLPEDL